MTCIEAEVWVWPLRMMAALLGIRVKPGGQIAAVLVSGRMTMWDGVPAVVGQVTTVWWN